LSTQAELRVLILVADWCGDVIRNVPVIFRVSKEAGIPVEVLTMGGRAIPIVIFVNSVGKEVAR
jgi:hypothetical protein